MGGSIFGSSSDSTATDNRQSAGDGARQLHGSGIVTAETGGKSVGARGKNIEAFGTDLTNAKIDLSQKIDAKGNVTIGDGGAAVASAAAKFADTIRGIVDNTTSAMTAATGASADASKHSLDAIVGLAETAATNGASSRGKLIVEAALWLGLFAALSLVAYFFARKKG